MTLDLSHLARPAKEQAFLDTKSRIKLVQTARWVGFERAPVGSRRARATLSLPELRTHALSILYGDSGMGKTMIVEKIERLHPSSYEERRGITLRPVLTLQMPPSPDKRRFIRDFSKCWVHPIRSATRSAPSRTAR